MDWLSWVGWGWLAVDLLDSYWPKYSKIEILGGLNMQRGKEQSHVLLKLHMRYVFKGLWYLLQHNRGKKEYLHLWIWIITIIIGNDEAISFLGFVRCYKPVNHKMTNLAQIV